MGIEANETCISDLRGDFATISKEAMAFMRIIRFQRHDGTIGWGLESDLGLLDISGSDATLPTSSLEVMARWEELQPRLARLTKRLGASEDISKLLCPLDAAGKILCVGLNYRDHAAESNMPVPQEPIIFCKMPTALTGPEDPIYLPSSSTKVDYEAEMVVVIGKKLRKASPEESQAAIFGYAVGNDVSARDWQLEKPGKQWFLGKTFDSFAPIGPGITLASSVEDVLQLRVQTRLNGELVQDSSTKEIIFSPTHVLSYLSHVMTLMPGDVIFTGTPPGVGMAKNPPRYLQPEDRVEIEIEKLGKISNVCLSDSTVASSDYASCTV